MEELLAEIQQLADLDCDWNDEGAPKIDPQCINLAREFVLTHGKVISCEDEQHMPVSFPCIDGGVSIEWRGDWGIFDIVFPPGMTTLETCEYRLYLRGEPLRSGVGDADELVSMIPLLPRFADTVAFTRTSLFKDLALGEDGVYRRCEGLEHDN